MRATPRTLRRHDRSEVKADIVIGWTSPDDQTHRFERGRCIDISESGLQVECAQPIPLRTYVQFRAESLKLEGSASVRFCVRKGYRHRSWDPLHRDWIS